MSILRRRPKDAPPRRDRSAEFASVVIERPRAVMAGNLAAAAPARQAEKLPREKRARQSWRDAARGEECTLHIPGACTGGTDTTVAAHWPGMDGDRGMSLKSFDACIAFACIGCHDTVDGRRKPPAGETTTTIELAWHRGHLRTLVRLAQKGLL